MDSVFVNCGGIAGYSGGGGSVSSCYNAGNMSYSSVTQEDKINIGGVLGARNYDGSCSSSYFLETTADKLIGSTYSSNPSDGSISSSDMKSEKFIGKLNSLSSSRIWRADSMNQNNGFPILVWELEITWN